ncbi:MAG: 4-phosphoerythronate dehydrogenase [Succinivibrionaceae bacterium]|nr:4-phosphoerythronate dehydrogenase [Succinivibrionaceae bacterium]
MKLVIDENIPYAAEYFGQLGEIAKVPSRHIPEEALEDADALIIRSVTKVNRELLDRAPKLSFVGTCTIGTDHVDQTLLEDRGIAFSSAPGCNRLSVGQYVFSSLFQVTDCDPSKLTGRSIGIIGGGNTGSAVAAYAALFDMDIRICDPFLSQAGACGNGRFVSYRKALASDIVTFHVPLTRDGPYPTYHMFGREEMESVRSGAILVNASRGDVWDNQALLAETGRRGDPNAVSADPFRLVMDVWEHEPKVLEPLIPHTLISTAHIAGYSNEGKLRGTSMIASAFCRHFGISVNLPRESDLIAPKRMCLPQGRDAKEVFMRLALAVYTPERDSDIFRSRYRDEASFDLIRKTYPGRSEWSSVAVSAEDGPTARLLAAAGFVVDGPKRHE